MATDHISFIVPMKNEEATLQTCLDSIVREMADGDELIVVDNGSTDGSLNIARRFKGIRLLECLNTFISGLRNTGASAAQGTLLAFIDADCLLTLGWRDAVIATLADASIAATGSKYALPPEPHWIELVWFSQRKPVPGDVSYINSGNLVIRGSVFRQSGGFDETLQTGEDAELCFRLRSTGHRIWENPKIEAVHLGNPKSLTGFYKKQRWHGLGMLGTYRISPFDKPLIMTLGFALSGFLLLVYMVAATLNQIPFYPVMLLLILLAPTMTALFRCHQFDTYTFLPHYLFLYTLYYAARTEALVRIILGSRGLIVR